MQGYIIAVVTVFTTDMQYQNNNKAENAQKPHKAKWNFHVQWMLLHLSKRCRNSRPRVEVKPRSIPWQKREGKGHRAAQEQSGLCSALEKVLPGPPGRPSIWHLSSNTAVEVFSDETVVVVRGQRNSSLSEVYFSDCHVWESGNRKSSDRPAEQSLCPCSSPYSNTVPTLLLPLTISFFYHDCFNQRTYTLVYNQVFSLQYIQFSIHTHKHAYCLTPPLQIHRF